MSSLVGPYRERCHLTSREETKWWVWLAALFHEDKVELGKVRPAFYGAGSKLLTTNGDSDAE